MHGGRLGDYPVFCHIDILLLLHLLDRLYTKLYAFFFSQSSLEEGYGARAASAENDESIP
jgi:hypothetical protein